MPLTIDVEFDLSAYDRHVELYMHDVWREACRLAVDEACRQSASV